MRNQSKDRLHTWTYPLSVGQRGAEWHAARKFLITGTAASLYPNKLTAIRTATRTTAQAASRLLAAGRDGDQAARTAAHTARDRAQNALKASHGSFWKGATAAGWPPSHCRCGHC